MTITRLIAWSMAAGTTCWAWVFALPQAVDPYAGLHVARDVAYRDVDGSTLRFDLFRPYEPDAPLPLLVAVHGGSWTGGSRREYARQFVPLTRSGFAVAVVDYRLGRPDAPSWDGALQDVLAALVWLLDHARDYKLDPTRVATIGTSSGGLLAALVAQSDRRIAAAVCLSTPTSLIDLAEERALAHEPARLFLGELPKDVPDAARSASPLDRVAAHGPAMLLIHGEDDAWVRIEQARRLQRRLDATNVPNRLVELPEARHGFDLQLGPPASRDLSPEVRTFLDQCWGDTRPNQHG